MSHLMGSEKLGFLDIDRTASLREGDYQIGLTAKKGGQLKNIDYFRGGLGLVWFVHIRNYWHPISLLDLIKNFTAFFQARTSKGRDGGTIGFVKGGFENIGNTEFISDLLIGSGDFQGEFARFQNIDASKEGEGQVVGNRKCTDGNLPLRIHE